MSVGRLSCCFYTLMTLTTYGRADNWPGMVKTEILTVPLPSFFCPVAKIPPGAYILELYQMKGHGHPKRLLIKLA